MRGSGVIRGDKHRTHRQTFFIIRIIQEYLPIFCAKIQIYQNEKKSIFEQKSEFYPFYPIFQTTPKIEESVINATKLMLEEKFLPELSMELHSKLSTELKHLTNQAEDRLKDEEIQALKAKVAGLEGVVNHYIDQITTMESKINHLETNRQALETTTKTLRDDIDRVEIASNIQAGKFLTLDIKSDDLETKTNNLETKNNALESKSNALETKTKTFEETSSKLRADINRVEGVSNQHTGKISRLVTKTNSLQMKTNRLEIKSIAFDTKTEIFERTSSKLRTDISRIERFSNDNTGQIRTLVTKTNALETKTSPVGSIVAWVPHVDSGDPNENLPNGWVRCDGSVIPLPSIWAGRHSPDLNGKRKFLRGGQDATALDMEDDMIQGNSW